MEQPSNTTRDGMNLLVSLEKAYDATGMTFRRGTTLAESRTRRRGEGGAAPSPQRLTSVLFPQNQQSIRIKEDIRSPQDNDLFNGIGRREEAGWLGVT